MPSTDARRAARRAAHTDILDTLEDDVIILVEDFAASALPSALKTTALSQIRDIVEYANTTGFIDPGALASSPLILGTGTPGAVGSTDQDLADRVNALASSVGVASGDQLLTNLAAMFAPIVGHADPNQRTARMNSMALVADGSIPVANDGLPISQHELAALQTRVNPLLSPLDALPATGKHARMNGMLKIADGTTAVNPDGSPSGTVDTTAIEAERDDAIAARDANLDLLNQLANAIHGGGPIGRKKIDDVALIATLEAL